eukprot:TRINITY_DN2578_c0_g1_i1.p1 TRINITY_DN2578_c0_g1~~TRINITY_DN2578_c0_g1_i1.p1  ORF type:complete len:169 (-),score=47.57 TRINITY_DN2578_c0_g1_i1:73-579(-)
MSHIVPVASPTFENSKSITPVVHKSGVVKALSSRKLWAAVGVGALVAVAIAVPTSLSHQKAQASSSSFHSTNADSASASCVLNGGSFELSTASSGLVCAERRDTNEVTEVKNGKGYFLDIDQDLSAANGGFWVGLFSGYEESTNTCKSEVTEVFCEVSSTRGIEYEGN